MSDLSLPPLTLLLLPEEAAARAPVKSRHQPFAWPTPTLP